MGANILKFVPFLTIYCDRLKHGVLKPAERQPACRHQSDHSISAFQVYLIDTKDGQSSSSSSARPSCPATKDSLAYILYTSGSTGKPKGVPVPHCAVVNTLIHTQEMCGFSPQDVFMQRTSVSFDVAMMDAFSPLHAGACIVPAQADANRHAETLIKQLQEISVTVLTGTTSQVIISSDRYQ